MKKMDLYPCATAILAVRCGESPEHGRHGRGTRTLIGFLIAIGMLLTRQAMAQPVPTINSASTDVVVVGKITEITLTGENIGDGKQIVVVGEPGVKVELPKPTTRPATTQPRTKPVEAVKINPKELKVIVTVTPDAARGAREIRVVTPNGITKPF